MKTINKKIIPFILTGFILSISNVGLAVEPGLTFNFMPFRYITVKGDAAKFRAITWMNDGYTGGIKEMGINKTFGKDLVVDFEGHAIPGDNDFESDLTLTKGNLGYLRLEYGSARV